MVLNKIPDRKLPPAPSDLSCPGYSTQAVSIGFRWGNENLDSNDTIKDVKFAPLQQGYTDTNVLTSSGGNETARCREILHIINTTKTVNVEVRWLDAGPPPVVVQTTNPDSLLSVCASRP